MSDSHSGFLTQSRSNRCAALTSFSGRSHAAKVGHVASAPRNAAIAARPRTQNGSSRPSRAPARRLLGAACGGSGRQPVRLGTGENRKKNAWIEAPWEAKEVPWQKALLLATSREESCPAAAGGGAGQPPSQPPVRQDEATIKGSNSLNIKSFPQQSKLWNWSLLCPDRTIEIERQGLEAAVFL